MASPATLATIASLASPSLPSPTTVPVLAPAPARLSGPAMIDASVRVAASAGGCSGCSRARVVARSTWRRVGA